MHTAPPLSNVKADALREVANVASGHAASALATLVGRRTMISVPNLSVVAVEDIPHRLGFGDARAAVAVMHVLGDVTGSLLIVMPEANARALCALLVGETAAGGSFDALARSALTETANILGGAYVGALGAMTKKVIMLSVPAFGVEPPDAVLAQHRNSSGHDYVGLCIETNLTFEGASCKLGAHILLVAPADALRTIIETLTGPT